jgi:hypothetical protein
LVLYCTKVFHHRGLLTRVLNEKPKILLYLTLKLNQKKNDLIWMRRTDGWMDARNEGLVQTSSFSFNDICACVDSTIGRRKQDSSSFLLTTIASLFSDNESKKQPKPTDSNGNISKHLLLQWRVQ